MKNNYSEVKIELINTKEKVDTLLDTEHFNKCKVIAFDTETTSLDITQLDIVGFSFAYDYEDKTYAYYVPISHKQNNESLFESSVSNLDRFYALQFLEFLLIKHNVIMHNAVFDCSVVKLFGYDIPNIEMDTLIMAILVDENNLRNPGTKLKELVPKYLGYKMTTFDELLGKDKKTKSKTIEYADFDSVVKYAADDSIWTLRLYQFFLDKFLADKEIVDFWEKIEKPLIPIYRDMFMKGIPVDTVFLKKVKKICNDSLVIKQREIYDYCGKEFNINSRQQLITILKELGISLDLSTKTDGGGVSLSEEALIKIKKLSKNKSAPKIPFVDLILEYRGIGKMATTYTDSLLDKVRKNRIHTSLKSLGAVSGRIISKNPNLQNLPTTNDLYKLKSFICAEKGCKLIDIDYSQIELRMLAHCSKDDAMIKIYQDGRDLHNETMLICKCKNRTEAKGVNFGISYGMGARSLSEGINVSVKSAQDYLDAFKKTYKQLFAYKKAVEDFYDSSGYSRTIFGRKRRIDRLERPKDIKDFKDYEKRMFGIKREIFNFVIQGSSADLLKIAMIRIDNLLKSYNNNKLYLLLTIHDEFIINCPNDLIQEITNKVTDIMCNSVKLRVPLEADASVGDNWYICKTS